jgi:hypothetical protein
MTRPNATLRPVVADCIKTIANDVNASFKGRPPPYTQSPTRLNIADPWTLQMLSTLSCLQHMRNERGIVARTNVRIVLVIEEHGEHQQ